MSHFSSYCINVFTVGLNHNLSKDQFVHCKELTCFLSLFQSIGLHPYLFFFNILFFIIYLFGSTGSQLRHAHSLVAACGVQFPDQRSNSGPLPWEQRVLATAPPGKSVLIFLVHTLAHSFQMFKKEVSHSQYNFPPYIFSLVAFKFFCLFLVFSSLCAWMWLSLYLSYLEFAELLGSLSLYIAAVNKLRTVWPLFLLPFFFFFFASFFVFPCLTMLH